MASQKTLPTNVFAQSLVAREIDARLKNTRVGKLINSPYVRNVSGETEPNRSGKTIDLPYFSDFASNDGVQTYAGAGFTTNRITLDTTSANINLAVLPFAHDLRAMGLLEQYGSVEAATAAYAVQKLEEELFAKIVAQAVTAAGAGEDIGATSTATVDVDLQKLTKHAVKTFGDKFNSDQIPSLVLTHSYCGYDIFADTKIQTAISYSGRNITENPWTDIGAFAIMSCDTVPTTGSGQFRKYSNIILREGALTVWYRLVQIPDNMQRIEGTLDYEHVYAMEYAVATTPSATADKKATRLITNASFFAA